MSSRPPRPIHAEHGGASFAALGTDFSTLERRSGIVAADVLDAWYDPSPRVVAAIAAHLPWLLRTSPPTHAEGLSRTISGTRGIPEENLLVGGGSSALAYMVLPHVVRPGDRALLLDPTYGEYAHLLEVVHGMRCQRTRLLPEDGFRLDVEAIVKAMEACDVLVLVNPNSPTGTSLVRDDVLRILDRLPRFGWLVVDETYADFAREPTTVEDLVSERDNLVVLKSLSKYYALSGVRVGYAAGPAELVAKVRPSSPPWSVGLLGQVAAVEALRDTDYYRMKADETRILCEDLCADLASIPGLRPHPSVANFVMVELLGDVKAEDVDVRLRERGIYLRNCDSLGSQLEGRFLRTTVMDADSNRRIVEALRAVVPAPALPEGVAPAEPAGLFRNRQPAASTIPPDGSPAGES